MKKYDSHDQVINRSLKHSVRDGAAYAVMSGSAETYFSAFAVFLKASTAQIGFLASVPALLASFAQLVSAWLGHVFGKRKAIILIGASLQALMWVPMAILLWLPADYQVEVFITCVILYHAFGNLAAPQWSSLMGELITENKRGRFFARRTRISSMTSFLALIAAGTLLHYFDSNMATKTGYLILFSVAFVARLVSVYHLAQMYDPPGHVAAIEVPVEKLTWRQLKESRFAGFSVFFSIMQFSVAIGSPFFSIYLLRDLGYSYVEFMTLAAATVFMQFLTLNRWGRISDIFGNRVILSLCGSLIPFVPFLWLFSHNFYYLLIVQAFGGVIWAGFTLSASNFLYDLIPQNKRATYMAAHNVLASIGVFAGALLGGMIGTVLPATYIVFGYELNLVSQLYNVFILSFVCRLLTSIGLIPRLKEIRRVKPVSVRRLIFRVVRFNPLTGLNFEVISSRRKSS
ncbi:MFS transporter [Sulfuriflexus mobilis]|uniref:MFS transporter n=1 Tax=Sulfuriflexus mobilis TaxID=1811807 RepID=UPI000F84687C|nr:MFS transporter [Sulfuriflexus mobilis]